MRWILSVCVLFAVGCGGDPETTPELGAVPGRGAESTSGDLCRVLSQTNLDEVNRVRSEAGLSSAMVICHHSNDGGKGLVVSDRALNAHLRHGDSVGECPDEIPPPGNSGGDGDGDSDEDTSGDDNGDVGSGAGPSDDGDDGNPCA